MRRLVCLGLLLCAASASAQTSDVSDLQEDARLHFQLGERAYNRGEFARAAEEFEEAYRLSNRAPLLYNTYLAYRDGREDERAADALRRYLAAAGDVPNRARLEETLRGLESDLRGEPRAEPESTETPVEQRSGGGGSVPIGPIAVLGVGAAIGIASIVTGALAVARNGDLSAACPDDFCPSEDARSIEADVELLSIVTDVLWPISVAALAAGIVWLAIELSSSGEDRAQLSCGPMGCVARGTFR
jgi:tetratricopeptide (TPR) repeat protein